MRKIPRTAKLDEAVGRVQFGIPRNFLNPIISKFDKHVVLLPINYRASENFFFVVVVVDLHFHPCVNYSLQISILSLVFVSTSRSGKIRSGDQEFKRTIFLCNDIFRNLISRSSKQVTIQVKQQGKRIKTLKGHKL